MHPWLLIAMLEEADPAFQDLFYPKQLRCKLDKRIVRAIEEHWTVYFPTRKECRGPNWTLTIPAGEPSYQPQLKSKQELEQWKNRISGTIAEMRAHRADISWNRFVAICQRIPRLQSFLRDFKLLTDFLINEESLWTDYRGKAFGQEELFQGELQAMLKPGSPYHHADPRRLRFLQSNRPTLEKIRMIGDMEQLFDRPLMALAILQKCANKSKHARFWLPIQDHIAAIINTPSPLTFRETWLEHAMQSSGAIKRTGKTCPRKWAKMLLSEKEPELDAINVKAIEVNGWLKGKKKVSLKNVKRFGQIILNGGKGTPSQTEAEKDMWLFSWMVTLWLERHVANITSEFKGDRQKIHRYYRRFFHYLEAVDFGQ